MSDGPKWYLGVTVESGKEAYAIAKGRSAKGITIAELAEMVDKLRNLLGDDRVVSKNLNLLCYDPSADSRHVEE